MVEFPRMSGLLMLSGLARFSILSVSGTFFDGVSVSELLMAL
jgi:hypothetical protein